MINNPKIPDNIIARRLMSPVLILAAPGYSRCSHCYVPWKFGEGKSMYYEVGSGYFPICCKCFYDESVSFQELLDYYMDVGSTRAYRFTTTQKDYMKDYLIREANDISYNWMSRPVGWHCSDDQAKILKSKYNQYLIDNRNNSINNILNKKSNL